MALSREYVLLSVGLIIAVGFTVAYMLRGTNRDVARAESVAPKVGSGAEWSLIKPIDRMIVEAPGPGGYATVPFKVVGRLDNSEMIVQINDDTGTFTLAGIDTDDTKDPTIDTLMFQPDSSGLQILVDDMTQLTSDHYTYEGYVYIGQDSTKEWTVDGTIYLTFTIGDKSETREILVRAPNVLGG